MPPGAGNEFMKITLIENFRAVFYTPFYASIVLGAYRAEGIDLELKASDDASKTLESVLSGRGQVSWGGPVRIMLAREKNPAARAVAFCEVVGRDPFFLLGRSPNPHFTFKDLFGKRVAIVAEVPTPWMCLQHDLRVAGLDPSRVTKTSDRTMSENASALRAGEVDVIQVFEPFASQLGTEGAGHIWYAGASRGPTTYTTFNAPPAFLEHEPDTAQGMCRAMYRTQKWIATKPSSELAEVVAPYFPELPKSVLTSSCDRYKALGVWNRKPIMVQEGFDWLRDAGLSSGLIAKRYAFEDCVDLRFAKEAVREDPPSL
jgi:NitT/TauT family transport system substrate-binding protein